MAISSTTSRNNYTGNDAVDTYSYTFKITDETHLLVTVREIATGVETDLTLSTHYTVTGVDESGGGNVVLVNGAFDWLDADGDLSSDYNISIRRVVPIKQESDIRNQGDFFPERHEDAFDYSCFIDQQQQDEIDRSVKLAETVSPSDFDVTLPADIEDNPGAAIIVNDDGDGLSLGVSSFNINRIFYTATYAALKALAAAAPTLQREGWATDTQQRVFYTADVTVGDDGWIVLG
jgi:hypothetical protein